MPGKEQADHAAMEEESALAIEVFHTRDQTHVTAGAAPFWGSSFATAAVAAVDMI